MGQTTSYAKTSVQRALRRLKLSEVEDENEVLRQCGYCRGDHGTTRRGKGSGAEEGDSDEERLLPKPRSKGRTASHASLSVSPSRLPFFCQMEESKASLLSESTAAVAPTPLSIAVARKCAQPSNALFGTGSASSSLSCGEDSMDCRGGAGMERLSSSGAVLPADHVCIPPPPTFGPLVKLDWATYTLDELRAAVPFLPEALHLDLNRFSLLYVLDADGDGRFSEKDILGFVEWAIRTLPPRVSADSLNEALQASCALECFQRCRTAVQTRRQGRLIVPTNPFWDTSDNEAEVCQAVLSSSGSSSASSTFSESLQSFTSPTRCMEEDFAATIFNENRGRRHKKRQSRGLRALSQGGQREEGRGAQAAEPRAASTATLAAVHLSSWYLRLLHVQEVDRRRDATLQRLRERHMLRSSAHLGSPRPQSLPLSPQRSSSPPLCSLWPERLPNDVLGASVSSPPASVRHSRVSSMAEDTLVHATAQSYREMDASRRYSIHAVEELYFDFGVRDSYDLSLWTLCHLLDPTAVKKVEVALDLSSDMAMRELRTAAALEEARRRKARVLMEESEEQLLQQQQQQLVPPAPPPLVRELPPAAVANTGTETVVGSVCHSTPTDVSGSAPLSDGAFTPDRTDVAGGPKSTESLQEPYASSLPQSGLWPTPAPAPRSVEESGHAEASPPIREKIDGAAARVQPEPVGVPVFSISHAILQPFVVCFVTSYWEMLRELRPDLFH